MSESPTLVAIDGPSGVGKSTTARGLARRLGIPYVDTGAMYRAIALACLRAGIDLDDAQSVESLADEARLLVGCEDGEFFVELDGERLGSEIRTNDVSLATSRISVHAAVRRRLVELQRDFGRRHGGVFEGRDIGTVVFPKARHKFFLEASPRVRARRRYDELVSRGEDVELGRLESDLEERDARDRSRAESPLRADEGSFRIDTGELTPDEVVEMLAERIAGGRGDH